MSPQEITDVHEQMHAHGRNALQDLGLGEQISGHEIATKGASVPSDALGKVPNGTAHPIVAGVASTGTVATPAAAPTHSATMPMVTAGKPVALRGGLLGTRGGFGAGTLSGVASGNSGVPGGGGAQSARANAGRRLGIGNGLALVGRLG